MTTLKRSSFRQPYLLTLRRLAPSSSVSIVLTALFMFQCGLMTYAQTPQEIAKRAFQSTVLLVMEDANGQPNSLGSGFFVREGVIASNLHVVEGSAKGYAKVVGQNTKYDIEGVTAVDAQRDLVLLKVSAASARSLAIGKSEDVQVGEPVYAVGNPQGLEGTFSQGIVSSIREVGTDKLLQITAPISPGSSGGPVLNTKGDVIGVSVATFRGGQNLNFAIPSSYLTTLLSKPGQVQPLKATAVPKAEKSILADLGGRSTEGVVGTQFVWESFIRYQSIVAFDGDFSFTLKNQLRESVENVSVLVIFFDAENSPLDVSVVTFNDLIPAGLARRVSGKTEKSVQQLTTPTRSATPATKVELRVLDFQIAK